jgi:hypothetical protein
MMSMPRPRLGTTTRGTCNDFRAAWTTLEVGTMSRFASFREFYPFYLSEHSNRTSRRLHFIGSCGVLALLGVAIWSRNGWWLLAALFCGYGFAWVGHFFYEKNRPATFRHPFYSFVGDWVMFKDIIIGRIKF